MKEIWKDIIGFEGRYEISNMGNVRNKKTKKSVKGIISNKGYLRVGLRIDGKKKMYAIHRLLAIAFIPNPENKPTIDHINAIKTDNRVDNLRWVTHKENNSNPNRIKKLTKKVKCVTTGEVFESPKIAAEIYGITAKSIHSSANPKEGQKYAGSLSDGTKLRWEYI